MKIVKDYIPTGRKNRPGYKLRGPNYITVHSTANTSAGANARAHGRYLKGAAANIPASWHFTVDSKEIRQHLPVTEVGWHAGDGSNGTGNRESIALEICENRDGNSQQAIANAAWLVAKLLKDYGLKIAAVKQHYDWSGKNCPRVLRGRKDGWANFLAAVEAHLNPAAAKAPATPAPSGGALYRVQVGAFAVKQNADACLKKARAAGFKDAFITGGAPAAAAPAPAPKPAPAPAPTPKPAAIKVGSRVRVKAGAKDYNGVQLASFVYGRTYDVIQVSGDRVVIGEGKAVTAAVRLKDLTLV